ncbi:MAG TPA: hypothetical protein VF665_09385 [Longimicrobium sp.]
MIAAAHDVPTGSWARNLAAWIVGAAAAWAVARSPGAPRWFLLIAPVALAGTLLNAPQDGVHRWIDAGPLHVNAAFVLLPAAVVALAALRKRRLGWVAAALTLGILVLQPDASQATALGAAMLVVLALLRAPAAVRAGGAVAIMLAVAGAWMRPDPLAPVPEVEEIIKLAWRWSPLMAIAAAALLAATILLPLRIATPGRATVAARALCVYFAAVSLAPALGAFPVPLVGVGMSSVLGFWLGAGALVAVARSTRNHEGEP